MHNEQVALVHCPRTGGTSIQHYMLEHLEGLRVPPGVGYDNHDNTVVDPDLPKGHVRIANFEGLLGRAPEAFDVLLAVTRNPYEVALSQWLFWRGMWRKGNRMVQHRVAAQHATLESWLQNPRSEYHVRYDYHNHRPPRYLGDDVPGYADHGGYFAYWLHVAGALPDNMVVLEIEELNDRLPDLLAPYMDGEPGEVPHVNATKPVELRKHYTEKAQRIVERRFAHAFEHWYEKGLPEVEPKHTEHGVALEVVE